MERRRTSFAKIVTSSFVAHLLLQRQEFQFGIPPQRDPQHSEEVRVEGGRRGGESLCSFAISFRCKDIVDSGEKATYTFGSCRQIQKYIQYQNLAPNSLCSKILGFNVKKNTINNVSS